MFDPLANMVMYERFEKELPHIETKLGHKFGDSNLLKQAFTHRSWLHEEGADTDFSNERLEFLGDAVLELIISDFLFRKFPGVGEGELSRIRSRLVDKRALLRYEAKLQLASHLLVGKGEMLNPTRKDSLRANLLEAILGGIFVDAGVESVRKFIFDKFEQAILDLIASPHENWKSALQELTQRRGQGLVEYRVMSTEGPEHEKEFVVEALVESKIIGSGVGKSKKLAEQEAAKQGLQNLENTHGS